MAKLPTTCPHCGKSLKPAKEPKAAHDWRPKLGKFLAYFAEEVTAIESLRLVNAGIILRIWTSQPGGYRRLNQMQMEGWIQSAGHGFYSLTERGLEVAKGYAAGGLPVVDGLTNLRPVTEPRTPDRPDSEDQIAPPSDWQIFFMKELHNNYPHSLVGLQPVIRYTRKAGYLIKGGTVQIRALVADGWLGWDGQRLVLTVAAKRLLGYLTPVDRTPGMDDQPPT